MTLNESIKTGESKSVRVAFLGVSTGRSIIQKLFLPWAECLGRRMFLAPIDLPLKSADAEYRKFVEDVRAVDSEFSGALVTSHKASLFDAAADIFDVITDASARLGEIGMIYQRDGKLIGDANDAISTSKVCSHFLGDSPAWYNGSRNALVLGGGGAGLALANTLVTDRSIACTGVTVTENYKLRAEQIRQRMSSWNSEIPVRVLNVCESADSLVSEAGPGSLIVNATGLGKDKPGSPVTVSAEFPLYAHVWEFNYRFLTQHEPTFLETALRNKHCRRLNVKDGWDYFIWGWLVVMATVVGLPVTEHYYSRFRVIADKERPIFNQ